MLSHVDDLVRTKQVSSLLNVTIQYDHRSGDESTKPDLSESLSETGLPDPQQNNRAGHARWIHGWVI